MGKVILGRVNKGWRGTQSLLATSSENHVCLYPRCGFCKWGTLEGPSEILSGHHEGLRDGQAECGGSHSGGGPVSGGGAAEISG